MRHVQGLFIGMISVTMHDTTEQNKLKLRTKLNLIIVSVKGKFVYHLLSLATPDNKTTINWCLVCLIVYLNKKPKYGYLKIFSPDWK